MRTLTAESPEMRKHRVRWWTLGVLCLSALVVVIDSSILNVALPTLQRELGASASGLQWIVTSYILIFGGMLLTTGSLGDRFGRAMMLRAGLIRRLAAGKPPAAELKVRKPSGHGCQGCSLRAPSRFPSWLSSPWHPRAGNP